LRPTSLLRVSAAHTIIGATALAAPAGAQALAIAVGRSPVPPSGAQPQASSEHTSSSAVPGSDTAPGASWARALRSVPATGTPAATRLRVARGGLEVLAGRSATVRGRLVSLTPLARAGSGLAGAKVLLERRGARGWLPVGMARTDRAGRFALRWRPGGASATARLRLLFSGDALHRRAVAALGRAFVLHPSIASWYYDGGFTACGFHATFGVANRVLPCGTRVLIRAGSHSVLAVVDDRGPFVWGRSWDLGQSTAAALRFSGVGTVWVSG